MQEFTRLEPLAHSLCTPRASGTTSPPGGRVFWPAIRADHGRAGGGVPARSVRRGYDDLVFAGFSFDGTAQATIQDDPNPRVRCHLRTSART